VNQLKRWNTWRSAPRTLAAVLLLEASKRASGIPLGSISQKESRSQQIHMSDAASHIDEFESGVPTARHTPSARPSARKKPMRTALKGLGRPLAWKLSQKGGFHV
jgi:hypothetical protein